MENSNKILGLILAAIIVFSSSPVMSCLDPPDFGKGIRDGIPIPDPLPLPDPLPPLPGE